MIYIYRLAIWLGFLSEDDVMYRIMAQNIYRARRNGTLDKSILDVLESSNDKNKEQK